MTTKYTCSAHNGVRFSQKHNCDKDFRNELAHTDNDKEIIILHNEPIKDFYNRFFTKSLNEYNDKQKRKDRKIDNYYQHILDNKKINVAYEMIIQVGNIEEHPDDEICTSILTDFYMTWAERNPNMECISASIHLDEKTPHLHIDYVPISYENKRGLSIQVGLEKALNEMNYYSDKFHNTAQIQWQKQQSKDLQMICSEYGLEIENPKSKGLKHLEKEDYIIHKLEEKEKKLQLFDKLLSDKEAQTKEKIEILDNEVQQKIEKANTLLKNNKDDYNNKIIQFKKDYEEKTQNVISITNQKLQDIQSQYDNKIIEFRNKCNKEREVYNNMCLKLNEKKNELKEIDKQSSHSIINDFLTYGKPTFGNKKIYTQEELDAILKNIKVVEGQLSNYNLYKKDIETLEKSYSMQVDIKNNIISNLQDNIDQLQEENINLKMFQNYVQDSNNVVSFEAYKKTKQIISDDVFSYDMKKDTYCNHKEFKIIDINEHKEKKEHTINNEKINKFDMEL